MALSDFVGPFIIAVILHALVFSSGSMSHDAAIVPKKGASSITLNMVTSIARASQPDPDVALPDVSGHNSKTGTDKEYVRPVSKPPQAPSVKRALASNRCAGANTDAPKVDATQRHEERVLSNENISRQEEPEIEQIVRIEEDVTESPLMLQKQAQVDAGAVLGTRDNSGDEREQGVNIPASAIGLSKPEYPWFSRIHGEEGTVVLLVEVLAHGRPGKIEIVTSSGFRRLDRAALRAVGRARFNAARVGGRSVDSTKRTAFRFDLDD